ncbi:hypothetical protein PIROE2DRAFT_66774, partial [Piromyces sp. E2]
MEDEMEELKEKTKNLEEALSKYEEVSEQNENGDSEDVDDVNEKSNITMTEEASEEIILLDDDYSENSKISNQIGVVNSFISEEEKITGEEKTELTTTEEQFDDEETNSLTLTEDLSEEDDERREFV